METYTTLDNGGIPFKVFINKKTKSLTVFKLTKIEFDKENKVISAEYKKKVVDTKFLNVFIGKSPKNKMTNFSKGYGKKFDGNTILAQIKSNTYMYIGETIYTFEIDSDETILAYQSPVGNNFVPYPYAISNKRIYFLLERKMVPLDVFPRPIKVTTKEDLYGFLYDRDSLVSISAKKIKKIKKIQGRV